jgi:DNA invertase Pin-like site-specific DNA recombinase
VSISKQNPSRISGPLRVAQYVRMSTEHQQYSPENQIEAIKHYAQGRGMEIVKTYADHGRSGLNVEGREGLRQLIHDVESFIADFSAVLVYDISRWGRFQDADESAYYEYILKRAGISVHYCAEQFDNDGSLPSALLKSLKRTMAGEYSRELSVKVFAGQCRLIEHGFRQGGLAGYGLRRQLLDRDGNAKVVLEIGQRKSLQTDRVILIPGPEQEREVVTEIYQSFLQLGKSEREIASDLDARGFLTDLGHKWTRGTVHQILINPKYIGSNVYNRRSFKLKRVRVSNPPDMWIIKPNAFEGIVSEDDYMRAQTIIESRHRSWSNEEMLQGLRDLLVSKGRLSGLLIDESEFLPSSATYSKRFGSLPRAYTLIGWFPFRDFAYLEINRRLRRQYKDLGETIIRELRNCGAIVSTIHNGLFHINQEFTASLVIAPCRKRMLGYRWRICFDKALKPDITVVARLNPENDAILDYYLFPALDQLQRRIGLSQTNHLALDVYRFESLNFFYSLSKRIRLENVA